ncbi:UNVERIFIED_CONTAM: hypothetical protein GTU68_039789, partial [Idotea baltica]|nr:hypothetical protein [Idotea baltica]
QVSWFRRRDWHILTTGIFTYTNDERFSVHHKEEEGDWTLQIKYTTQRDNGTYECQLSTGTGVISQFVNLNVVVPKATIQGNREYHVQLGSTIKLVCVIGEVRRDEALRHPGLMFLVFRGSGGGTGRMGRKAVVRFGWAKGL